MESLIWQALDDQQVQSLLRPFWLDIQQLTRRFPDDFRAGNVNKVLDDVRLFIFRGTPVVDWDAAASASFHHVSATAILAASREAILTAVVDERDRNTARADRLCSLVALGQLPAESRLEVARAWLDSRFDFESVNATQLDTIVEASADALSTLGTKRAELVQHLKAQLVLRAAFEPKLSEDRLAWVRQSCEELCQDTVLRRLLDTAASALGVTLTAKPQKTKPPEKDPQLTILSRPPAPGKDEMEERRQNILFDLPAYTSEKDCVFNPTTLRQARQLTSSASEESLKALIYFAASDLWKRFWTRGDRKLLVS